jgi:hypothetical protein
MRTPIKYLIIHCTATAAGREVSGSDIRRWHLLPKPEGRGWKQVGYTDLFHLNGGIERLVENNEDAYVDGWEITNGAAGANSYSRHIVYVGGLTADGEKPQDTRTIEQRKALKKYILDFVRTFPDVQCAGHNQFSNKACPCFDVPKWLKEIGINQKNIKR